MQPKDQHRERAVDSADRAARTHRLVFQTFRLRENGATTFLTRIHGAVTMPAARSFEHHVAQLIASIQEPSRILLDLNGMTSIDSAGLTLLVQMQRHLMATGGTFELLDPSAAVVMMLHEAATADGSDSSS